MILYKVRFKCDCIVKLSSYIISKLYYKTLRVNNVFDNAYALKYWL